MFIRSSEELPLSPPFPSEQLVPNEDIIPKADRSETVGNTTTIALPSIEDEARVFFVMRTRTLLTTVRAWVFESRLRLLIGLTLGAVLWIGMLVLFLEGFHFVRRTIQHNGTLDQLIQAVFGMFFVALMIMLVFSGGILLYGSLFRTGDLHFLLSLPIRTGRIFLFKFQETLFLAGWAFVFLSSPLLLAYGIVMEAPWYYYVLVLPMLAAFTYIPASLGALASLAITRWLPKHRTHVLVACGIGVIALAIVLAWSVISGPRGNLLTPSWFNDILARMRFAEGRLLPSWWLSMGLLELARHHWDQGLLFLGVLISNALFLRQIATWFAQKHYRTAYSRLYGTHSSRGRVQSSWMDRLVMRVAPTPHRMRLLLIKDFRLFRRDPVQWSQFLVFFGLLGLYIANIRRFTFDFHQYVGWANMVSFLNLAVVGLILSTFTTRFVFPMVSLEVKRMWLLGLLPIRRETVLMSKFLFSAGGSILPCAGLVLLSDLMLQTHPLILGMHQLTCLFLCIGLSGIAVGLGAKLPELREEAPSRIAAGFGGTLTLVVSAVYIMIIVLLTALPCHFILVSKNSLFSGALQNLDNVEGTFRLWLFGGVGGSVVLGILATCVPLWMGIREFRRMEFS